MIWLIVYLTCLFVAVWAGLMSAWSDVKGMTIPNHYALIVAGSFLPAYLVAYLTGVDVFSSVLVHIISVVVVFAVTFGMFAMGMFGGGDSKLITAFSLWFGGGKLALFTFVVAIAGSLVGVVALILKKWKPVKDPAENSWVYRVQNGENVVPYGVAIIIGAVVVFLAEGYFALPTLLTFLGESPGDT